jgi:hypothetical protein
VLSSIVRHHDAKIAAPTLSRIDHFLASQE